MSKRRLAATNSLRGTGFPAGRRRFLQFADRCHPERRLPESKDLAAAVFCGRDLSAAHEAALRQIKSLSPRASRDPSPPAQDGTHSLEAHPRTASSSPWDGFSDRLLVTILHGAAGR